MSHQVNVYYMHCPGKKEVAGSYHTYQREIADKILNHGLRNMFQIDGTAKSIAKGTYGKPYLKGQEQYQYNISNTEGMVVCALSEVCLGVDVERIKPFRQGVLRKCASPWERTYILENEKRKEQEERFFRLWTLKESYIKMTGEGLRVPLTEVFFTFSGEDDRDDKITCSKNGSFYQKRLRDYWIALCVREDAEVHWIGLEDI